MSRARQVRDARFSELDLYQLYGLLALRVAVFVVEQRSMYADLDARDAEPGARHLWIDGDSPLRPAACLRVVDEPSGAARIGRVCTAPDRRGQGLAGTMLRHALGLVGEREVVLDAQSHLAGYYAGFGFAVCGPQFLEGGIPHLPMRRPAAPA